MDKVYIVAAKRSPIGSFLGTLSSIGLVDFSAQVLTEAMKKHDIDPTWIDEVLIGNVLPAGQKQGVARQIAVASGIPYNVCASSINMICGSGMKSVLNGYLSIQSGFANLVVAGGVESMSQTPYLVSSKIRNGYKMGHLELIDYVLAEGLTDAFENYHMGITAESIANKYQITRQKQDDFAYQSQLKAKKAQKAGLFDDEIIPVIIKDKKGDVTFKQDEYINHQTTREKMAKLKPVFQSDGTITAANASGINDGASFIILASETAVKKYQLKPLAQVVGIGQAGIEPSLMGLGPVLAIQKALDYAQLKLSDIDVIELNEAFAAQTLGVVEELSSLHHIEQNDILSKMNINGGAIALGHPIGSSGNRIIVTLVHHMLKNQSLKTGLASLCIGGGMGTAIILKKA